MTETTPRTSISPNRRPYLLEIDFMRACIMLGVVSVHMSAFVNGLTYQFTAQNVALEWVVSSLHFTREAFMFITGIVLFTTYYNGLKDSVWIFWKKRFQLIAIPYIVWTTAYVLFNGLNNPGFAWSVSHLVQVVGQSLLNGNQFFLYYILVTMQFYLVFPLVMKWLRHLHRYHWWILAGSFALQIAMMWFNKTVLVTLNPDTLPSWISWLDQYRDRFVFTYQFWFIAGAVFAIHYRKVSSWVDAKRTAVYICFGLMTIVLWGHAFVDRVWLRQSDDMTVLVLQPIMVPYSFFAAMLMWQVGRAWVNRIATLSNVINKPLRYFSKHSFGIFLLHPFALTYVEMFFSRAHLAMWQDMTLILPAVAVIYISAALVAMLLTRTPYLSYLVGRRWSSSSHQRIASLASEWRVR